MRAIPPFGGALIRYNILPGNGDHDDRAVSVYLDGYNVLGIFGHPDDPPKPYWEVYPYPVDYEGIDEDVKRIPMEDTQALVAAVRESVRYLIENRDE